jgi:hypothetical protein
VHKDIAVTFAKVMLKCTPLPNGRLFGVREVDGAAGGREGASV